MSLGGFEAKLQQAAIEFFAAASQQGRAQALEKGAEIVAQALTANPGAAAGVGAEVEAGLTGLGVSTAERAVAQQALRQLVAAGARSAAMHALRMTALAAGGVLAAVAVIITVVVIAKILAKAMSWKPSWVSRKQARTELAGAVKPFLRPSALMNPKPPPPGRLG